MAKAKAKEVEVPGGRRLEYMLIAELVDASRNPKKHTADIPVSIERFGYVEPMVLDERTGRLVAGHGRKDALIAMAKSGVVDPPEGVRIDKKGRWLAPVIRGWSSKDDSEAEAYLIASNRLTEVGGWDSAVLAKMLGELDAADALIGVGFSDEELTKLLDAQVPPEDAKDPDDVPDVLGPSRIKPGELWLLGDHQLLCGSATEPSDVDRVMQGEKADICWTDPPWNVALVSDGDPNNAKRKKRDIESIANDNLGEAFPGFVADFCGQIHRVLKPGGMLYMAMAAQEWPTIHGALTGIGFHWSSTLIWSKDQFCVGRRDYHSQYEPIWYGWKGDGPRLRPMEDRGQSDVWPLPRPKRSDEHPTMKPVELVARALRNSSLRGDLVFEPFSGSGTTLMACEATNRRCRAIELEPKYVQVAIERWEQFTGKIAVRAEGSLTEEVLAAEE